jgi:hypothetical protein
MKSRSSFPGRCALIADAWPHARTQEGRECRSRGLFVSQHIVFAAIFGAVLRIPGPLTLRMMERVWSSMNSTRHWVTPPREPGIFSQHAVRSISFAVAPHAPLPPPSLQCGVEIRVPVRPRTRVTLTSLTGALAVSMLFDCVVNGNRRFVWSSASR